MATTAKKNATPYVVKAACIVAKINSETGEGYLYRGMILPDGVPDEEIERLADMGLIETKATADKRAAAKKAATRTKTEPDDKIDSDKIDSDKTDSDNPGPDGQPPAKPGSK